jgi:hypothetical protein
MDKPLHEKKISELFLSTTCYQYNEMCKNCPIDGVKATFDNCVPSRENCPYELLKEWAIDCVKEMRRVRDIEFSVCEYWLIDKFEIKESELR